MVQHIIGKNHFIAAANKNSAEALTMAMELCSKGGHPYPDGVQELVHLINHTAIALSKLCTNIAFRQNDNG